MIKILLLMVLGSQDPTAPTTACEIPSVKTVPVLRGRTYREPIQVLTIPGDKDSILVVERSGRILRAPLNHGTDELLLDLRGVVSTRNSEEGLLSVALHPRWKETGVCYVYKSLSKPRRTVLSRFTRPKESTVIDPESEEVLLTINQPYGNHNGGTVLFGPDHMLYLSVGDGGSANDPHGNGQDKSNLLGTIVRLDVSGATKDTPYLIPKDNPFLDQKDVRPEIWAFGLRNVWRMSFDPKTGELWAGDVGQNAWEEIDIIRRGGNYGWNLREGRHLFQSLEDEPKDLVDPVIEYGRGEGGSVTGGSVYRGSEYPSLDGVYIYGDYMSGRLWGACRDSTGAFHTKEITGSKRLFPSSFGTGPNGEILACVFSGPYQRSGQIVKVQPTE
ncbi:MAG: PQQ-dependent sugar dehydrogenase [Planctomycetes bacterium]|nr:PQQ-dependent sugar dehydrogenase [Planctomycetota bacterium]MCP4838875.1 PQQ-dependent sugar dehydrogenase [Planctomycetota bacterium]